MLTSQDTLSLKAVERKGKNKLEDNHLKRLMLDLDGLLKTLQQDDN